MEQTKHVINSLILLLLICSIPSNLLELCICRCVAKALDWMMLDDIGSVKYDIILIFECVYNESLYDPLLRCIDRVCKDDSIIFLGLTRLFASPSFFVKLKSKGYQFTMIPEMSLPGIYSNQYVNRDVGLFCVRKKL